MKPNDEAEKWWANEWWRRREENKGAVDGVRLRGKGGEAAMSRAVARHAVFLTLSA